eukprot:14173455-Alexandrium_andersonii.AAC.1
MLWRPGTRKGWQDTVPRGHGRSGTQALPSRGPGEDGREDSVRQDQGARVRAWARGVCGECVMYLKPQSAGMRKADSRWDIGVWLGMRDRAGAYLIGTDTGVIEVWATRRRGTKEEQWGKDITRGAQGVPWEQAPGRGGVEVQARVEVPEDREPPQPFPEPEGQEYN